MPSHVFYLFNAIKHFYAVSTFDVVTLCSGVFESIETVDYNETDTITITTEIIDAGPAAKGEFSYWVPNAKQC